MRKWAKWIAQGCIKNLVEATIGIMVPLYSVLFLFWVIEIYFTGENYSIIKTTSFKSKEKSS